VAADTAVRGLLPITEGTVPPGKERRLRGMHFACRRAAGLPALTAVDQARVGSTSEDSEDRWSDRFKPLGWTIPLVGCLSSGDSGGRLGCFVSLPGSSESWGRYSAGRQARRPRRVFSACARCGVVVPSFRGRPPSLSTCCGPATRPEDHGAAVTLVWTRGRMKSERRGCSNVRSLLAPACCICLRLPCSFSCEAFDREERSAPAPNINGATPSTRLFHGWSS